MIHTQYLYKVTKSLNTLHKMKVSYRKEFDKDGTVYNQKVRITDNNESFIKLVNEKINTDLTAIKQKTIKSYDELKLLMFLHPIKKGKNYLTHTTRDFIFNVVLGVSVKSRNTLLVV